MNTRTTKIRKRTFAVPISDKNTSRGLTTTMRNYSGIVTANGCGKSKTYLNLNTISDDTRTHYQVLKGKMIRRTRQKSVDQIDKPIRKQLITRFRNYIFRNV